MKRSFGWAIATTAALLAGCGGVQDELPAEDDYAAAIPDGEMLALTADGDGQSVSGLSEGPAGFKDVADGVMAGLNQIVSDTQDTLRSIAMNVPEVDIRYQGKVCKVWEFDHAANHFQLISCEEDRRARRYAFVLRGRPAESTSDEDYLAVFAGAGRVFPRHEGRRRGAGVIGYDFDNLAALTGEDVQGKVAIGYRVVGRGRQLAIGLDKVMIEGEETSAFFRFDHVLGRGGRFVFWTAADVLTRDSEDQLASGADGTVELVRAAIAWNATGAARTAYTACGGTVGQACVSVVQCWSRTGAETYAEVAAGEQPQWDEAQCPLTAFDVIAPDESIEEPGEPGEPDPIDGE